MRTVISKPHKIIFHFSRATLKKKKRRKQKCKSNNNCLPVFKFPRRPFPKIFSLFKKINKKMGFKVHEKIFIINF